MFTDQDIFITNTTSTYQDIPKDCKLVGAELDHPDSIYLNLTDSGPFWVGAPKGSKRNISPLNYTHYWYPMCYYMFIVMLLYKIHVSFHSKLPIKL